MEINYNKLLEIYKVQFEGLNNPVFYSNLSPTHLLNEDRMPKDKQDEHSYISSLYKFAHGLKVTKENKYYYDDYTKNKNKYFQILIDFFGYILQSNPQLKFGVVSIPSSKKNVTNCITMIIKDILKKKIFPQLFDYTDALIRSRTKDSAHESGNRDHEDNINSLKLNLPINCFQQVNGLIIIDDIITTGSSFNSVIELVEDSGFLSKNIICFAFARSMNRTSILSYKQINKISGVIFDFDQTLIDSANRNYCFEGNIEKWRKLYIADIFKDKIFKENESQKIYSAYDGVKEFQEKHIPFAIVSDSGRFRLNILLQTKELQTAIYPYAWKMHYAPDDISKKYYEKYFKTNYNSKQKENKYHNYLVFRYDSNSPQNLFPYEKEEHKGEKEDIIFTKPNCHSICKAIKWMKINFNLICPRIIGVGNTLEDIIAYHNAGIEAVLALWGVPEILKDYAKSNWKADYVFTTFREFTDWVEKENGDK